MREQVREADFVGADSVRRGRVHARAALGSTRCEEACAMRSAIHRSISRLSQAETAAPRLIGRGNSPRPMRAQIVERDRPTRRFTSGWRSRDTGSCIWLDIAHLLFWMAMDAAGLVSTRPAQVLATGRWDGVPLKIG